MLLNNPLSLNELLGNGSQFELSSEFNKFHDDLMDSDEEEFSLFSGDPIYENEQDPRRLAQKSPWEKPFDELKPQMELLSCGIYKQMIKPGFGKPVVTNTRTVIHYNGFWENEIDPFDSTYLRNKPHAFKVGKGEVLQGLEAAVLTMKVGEEAQYIMPYTLLYGRLGCPPRIKPLADGLFVVTVINSTDLGDDQATENLDPEEQNKFANVIEAVHQVRLSAVDAFQRGQYQNAIKCFLKATKTLEGCNLMDKSDEIKQREILIKLYTNLAVTYNKTNQPRKACQACNRIKVFSNINNNCKAVFQEGRALLKIGEFGRARDKLRCALKLEPDNAEIKQELQELAEKYKQYDQVEKEICQRALGLMAVKESRDLETESSTLTDALKETISTMFQEFLNQPSQSFFTLPDGFNEHEIEYIEQEAVKCGLELHRAQKHDRLELVLKKKKTE